MSTPEKEPIPEEFQKWSEEMIHYSQQWDAMTGKEALKAMAEAAYRHLSSQKAAPEKRISVLEEEIEIRDYQINDLREELVDLRKRNVDAGKEQPKLWAEVKETEKVLMAQLEHCQIALNSILHDALSMADCAEMASIALHVLKGSSQTDEAETPSVQPIEGEQKPTDK